MHSKFISERMDSLQSSQTLAISSKAKQLKKLGKNVLDFSIGEPDFDADISVRNVAIQHINQGNTSYTAADGMLELKEAVRQKFIRDINIKYEDSEIICSTGAKQSIFNAFMATLNQGDEVIIPTPFWTSYFDIIKFFGGTVKKLRTNFSKNFEIDFNELENLITDKTKWIAINSPCNPSGKVISKKELDKIAEILKKYPNIHLMSDDIYEYIYFDSKNKSENILKFYPELKERVLIVNGLSKNYSMTGWRIGFSAGNKTLIKQMSAIQSQCTSSPCKIAQVAATQALNGKQDYIQNFVDSYKARALYVFNQVNKSDFLEMKMPEGAFYAFISIQKTIQSGIFKSSMEFCQKLLEEEFVCCVPGEAFGYDDFFRLSFATDMTTIQEGLKKIENFIKKYNIQS